MAKKYLKSIKNNLTNGIWCDSIIKDKANNIFITKRGDVKLGDYSYIYTICAKRKMNKFKKWLLKHLGLYIVSCHDK